MRARQLLRLRDRAWMPLSVGVRTISAPSTFMTAVLGPTNFSGTTTITRYPRLMPTSARPTPVLPAVGSTIVAPGCEPPVRLRGLDHAQRGAVLDAAARVQELELRVDGGARAPARSGAAAACGVRPHQLEHAVGHARRPDEGATSLTGAESGRRGLHSASEDRTSAKFASRRRARPALPRSRSRNARQASAGSGRAQQVALHAVAAAVAQERQLLGGLDALGHDLSASACAPARSRRSRWRRRPGRS